MHRGFAQVAINNLSHCIQPSDGAGLIELHHIIATLTGLPVAALFSAEQQMAATGSITPLKMLLGSHARAHGRFEFRLTSRRMKERSALGKEALRSRIGLLVWSPRGALQVTIDMLVPKAQGQDARMWVAYRCRIGDLRREVVRELTVRAPLGQARAA